MTSDYIKHLISNYPSFNDIDMKLAFLPNIKRLTVIEFNCSLSNTTVHTFTKMEPAIEYFLDLNLRSESMIPLGFQRESCDLSVYMATDGNFVDWCPIHPNIVELLYENWTHDYDLKTGKKIEREPLAKTIS